MRMHVIWRCLCVCELIVWELWIVCGCVSLCCIRPLPSLVTFVPVVQNLKSARGVRRGLYYSQLFFFQILAAACLSLPFSQWGCEYGMASELD